MVFNVMDMFSPSLAPTWMQAVLKAVGNYGEAYDRSFCDGDGTHSNCLIDRAGTMNALASEGGLQYAPPMRMTS